MASGAPRPRLIARPIQFSTFIVPRLPLTSAGSRILKKSEYMVGRITIVMKVPSVSPNVIATAIETQKTSLRSGITPKTVVPAASKTGRKRDTAAFITASKGL